MKITSESGHVSSAFVCYKIEGCTLDEYKIMLVDFDPKDLWGSRPSKVPVEQQPEPLEFYILLDKEQSMLFKLRYSSDK